MRRNPFFVVNPHSASGRTVRLWQKFQETAGGKLGAIGFEMTRGTMHAAKLAAEALRRGCDLVVAVGGDGTLNEVLNGFFRVDEPVRERAALGYLPSGTGSDFARTLGFHGLSLSEHLDRLLKADVRLIDCGQVRFPPGEETRLFLNESSLGFSAETGNNVNKASKRFGGKAAFFIGVLRTLSALRNPVLQVSVDGRPVYEGPTLLVTVANGRYFGGSMMIAPMAVVDDGQFDIVVVTSMTRLRVLQKISKIYRGEHLAEPEVKVFQGREVHISAGDENVLLEMDGELAGHLAADFRISHRTIPFLY